MSQENLGSCVIRSLCRGRPTSRSPPCSPSATPSGHRIPRGSRRRSGSTIVGNDEVAAPGISVEVADVDAVHAKAVDQGPEIAYPSGTRSGELREPSGTLVDVLSHRQG
jgi:hypothetical protein